MCYCVYLGADADLSIVASDDEEPVFSVQPLAASDVAVVPNFTKKNIYHLGSWQGCSYGFANDIDFEDAELVAKNASSVNALLSFIDSALSQEEKVELYTCWAGNQWQPPKERRSASLDAIQYCGFELEEDIFLIFTRP
ncbi:hypothetical protein KLP40_13820 [Hymenobacter sp. NST-14]|uniref:hypothetical protein n=1 Tax=Hymenobacter piscis TaxID=2839984 RepID=UPI001C01F0D3|nr:hypothetical protein [Hymenobacter piscis]MBT9394244.1 hypothetical protein [Hymenobacter piscis]